MVKLSPFQRLGSFGFWGTIKTLNIQGLLVGSLAVGGMLAIASELAVHGAANACYEAMQKGAPTGNAVINRAVLVPRYKPDFVRNWEKKYGQQ
jgi:hypothetical protein